MGCEPKPYPWIHIPGASGRWALNGDLKTLQTLRTNLPSPRTHKNTSQIHGFEAATPKSLFEAWVSKRPLGFSCLGLQLSAHHLKPETVINDESLEANAAKQPKNPWTPRELESLNPTLPVNPSAVKPDTLNPEPQMGGLRT